MDNINFADPANIRKTNKGLMSQTRSKAIHISNKYKIQIEHIWFEWYRFLSTLEKDFPEILNVVLSHSNTQQQLPNPNENRRTPNKIGINTMQE